MIQCPVETKTRDNSLKDELVKSLLAGFEEEKTRLEVAVKNNGVGNPMSMLQSSKDFSLLNLLWRKPWNRLNLLKTISTSLMSRPLFL